MTMTNLQKMEMGFDESEKSLVNEKIWFEDRDGHFKFCEEQTHFKHLSKNTILVPENYYRKCFTSLQTFNKYHILI